MAARGPRARPTTSAPRSAGRSTRGDAETRAGDARRARVVVLVLRTRRGGLAVVRRRARPARASPTPATRAFAAMWACYVGYAAGTGMDLALAYGDGGRRAARARPATRRLLAEATMLLAGRATSASGDLDPGRRAVRRVARDVRRPAPTTGVAPSASTPRDAPPRCAAISTTAERLMTESVRALHRGRRRVGEGAGERRHRAAGRGPGRHRDRDRRASRAPARRRSTSGSAARRRCSPPGSATTH